jgi:hypothetical protein
MVSLESSIRIQDEELGEKSRAIYGGQRAVSFIKDVVAGHKVDGKRYGYNEDFLLEINRRVVQAPHITDHERLQQELLRKDDTKKLGFIDLAHFYDLQPKLYLYGQWFQGEMTKLSENPEDIVMALEIASAAHYGLVMHAFHPFENGNGRTARAVMNTVLMSQSYELTAHGLAIPPIPIVRDERTNGKYIAALRAIDEKQLLDPFMVFIAQRWTESIEERLTKIHETVGVPKNEGDMKLVSKLQNRLDLLQDFIRVGVPEEEQVEGTRSKKKSNGHTNGHKYHTFPLPQYFGTKYVLFLNASEQTVK